jgi:hypothetical protein
MGEYMGRIRCVSNNSRLCREFAGGAAFCFASGGPGTAPSKIEKKRGVLKRENCNDKKELKILFSRPDPFAF